MISLNNVTGIIRRWKNSIISLRLRYLEIPHKNFWVSRGVLLKGFGVQKGSQTPCWLRPWCRITYCRTHIWRVSQICIELGSFRIIAYLYVSNGSRRWQRHLSRKRLTNLIGECSKVLQNFLLDAGIKSFILFTVFLWISAHAVTSKIIWCADFGVRVLLSEEYGKGQNKRNTKKNINNCLSYAVLKTMIHIKILSGLKKKSCLFPVTPP